MKTGKNKVEICLTPSVFPEFRNDDAIVVVVDILRATSAIITAFMNGVRKIIPVATLEEAKAYKDKGYLVAAERDGIVRDFADFGNSPFNFQREIIRDREIVYSTTNGTQCIKMAENSYRVLIGGYLNLDALGSFIQSEKHDLLILCAGWKNRFSLEDTLFAGALAETVLKNKNYYTICDSTIASIDLWTIAQQNMMSYIEKAAQRHRLKKNGLDDVLEYCHTLNLTRIIPLLKEDALIQMNA
ncbi:MAG: 2-phosphosulfolactate phosphatase [Bacteroidales bacterium]|nr:2-phosphosulfolactate phosphatase [Bacteroidales bacterium]MBN2764366.1 2-phosphosulfolactate phosphatase [Bacteroidales bacterium]